LTVRYSGAPPAQITITVNALGQSGANAYVSTQWMRLDLVLPTDFPTSKAVLRMHLRSGDTVTRSLVNVPEKNSMSGFLITAAFVLDLIPLLAEQ
jgi:hypothetical protein